MRLLVCDDHVMFLDAIVQALGRRGYDVLASTSDLDEVVGLAQRTQPDVCLLDLWFGDRTSLDEARLLDQLCPDTHVVLLTGDPSAEAVEALGLGVVDAIAGKTWTLALIEETLAKVMTGRRVRHLVPVRGGHRTSAPRLTEREREVLGLMASGASTADMRASLAVSEHTVRSHVRSLLAKLGAHSRVEALRMAHDAGLVGAAGRR